MAWIRLPLTQENQQEALGSWVFESPALMIGTCTGLHWKGGFACDWPTSLQHLCPGYNAGLIEIIASSSSGTLEGKLWDKNTSNAMQGTLMDIPGFWIFWSSDWSRQACVRSMFPFIEAVETAIHLQSRFCHSCLVFFKMWNSSIQCAGFWHRRERHNMVRNLDDKTATVLVQLFWSLGLMCADTIWQKRVSNACFLVQPCTQTCKM